MDPNATLAELLEWANEPATTDAETLAQERFLDLHEWLSKGGTPPRIWQHDRG